MEHPTTGPFCIWMTGLSDAGKTSTAQALQKRIACHVLDGDVLRQGLNADLDFTTDDRERGLYRTAHVARILFDAGVTSVVACISPTRESRRRARWLFPVGRFVEVYVATPLEVCEARDSKGLYARARAGELPLFTGIGASYEPPRHPEIIVGADGESLEEAAEAILNTLRLARLLH